ncbi:hypothetical protein [Proteiniphilum sp. X52]|uniref:hypothetical protein n=1 Tax=Proteiniphilum sp. X52 TaxID=2382159 RepID=UPI00351AA40F
MNNPLVYVDEDGEFIHLIIGAVVGGIVNWATHGFQFNAKGLGYFAVGAAVGTLSAMGGAWAAATFKAVGVAAGVGIGAVSGGIIGGGSSFLLNGGNNLIAGNNFFDNWKSNLISGAVNGAITGAIGGGIKGYKYAKKLDANPWTGKKVYSETSYKSTVKTGIAAQSDPNKHCYSVSDEYASSGRENYSRLDFQNEALGADGADPLEIYKSKTGKDIFKINNWDIVGKELNNNSAEIIGVVSQNGTNHSVNVVGYTVENRLKLFGGGVKQIIKSVLFWDPAVGRTVSGHSNFIKVGYFRY